jgi:hypothetical protein
MTSGRPGVDGYSRMIVRRPSAIFAALVAVLAVAASGCGGSAVAVPELTSLTQIAQKSSATDTARFALTLEMTVPGADRKLSFSAEGGFDTPAKRAQLTFDLSSFAELFKSLGSSFGGKVEGELGSPDDWKLEAIRDGETTYIRFPLIAKQLPAGKTWIKGDAKDLSSADAGRLSQFGSFAGTDPRDIFGVLKAVSGSIESVGSEKIRGVETSHYRATVDTAKLEQLVPAGERQSLGSLGETAKQAGLTELPLDVWIDADQRVAKLSVDVDAKQPGSDAAVKASLVVELYDYGVPLDLELPPADQVVDAATLKKTP